MSTRRSFLKLAGAASALTVGGAGFWAATRDPARARMPWDMAGKGERDPRRYALANALLAPNPHNRQPWLADLESADAITLYCAPDRRLPHTDPFDRQTVIGLGCFIELLSMAAAETGHLAEVELFPDGEPQPRLDRRPVAHVRFVADADAPRDPLFANVPARRSNKEPYDVERIVPVEAMAGIARAARVGRVAFANEPAVVAELRAIAWEAMVTEMETPRTLKESIDLLRIGRDEIEASPDGISISGPIVEALAMAGLLSREALLDPSSSAFRQQVDALRPQFETAMAFLWLATPGNGRSDQIAAGRDYVRLNLAATGLGVSMQPLSQALQEFEEMREFRLRLRDRLEIAEAETLQMFVRLGYGPRISGAPRWPLDSRIRSG